MGLLGSGARSVVGRALDLALPAMCVGCGVEGAPICLSCGRDLDRRLGTPPGWPIGMPCDLPAPLAQVDWCAPYAGVVREALHALKYAGERRLATPLGHALARRFERAAVGGDVLVPVPVHAARLADRGYDQAVLLARQAAADLRVPLAQAVVRTRATARQFDLDRGRRAANVAGAFAVAAAERGAIAGRWVVLVDDVVTTGATAAACARALVDAGALAVSAMVVARER